VVVATSGAERETMSQIEVKVRRLAEERPEYKEILRRAVEVEEHPPDDFVRDYGWEWYHVGAHPARLTKLVGEGIVKVTYKSRRYTHYKLVDRDAVKRALGRSK